MGGDRTKKRKILLALLCVGMVVFAGCGAKEEDASRLQAGGSAEEEVLSREEPGTVDEGEQEDKTEEGGREDEAEEQQDDREEEGRRDGREEQGSRSGELWRAQTRHYYGGILSQIIAAWQLPDGELDTSALETGGGEMEKNYFAVTDIDGDGREELIVNYVNAIMAGMMVVIYDYDPVLGELKRELTEFPALTFYDNGVIKAEASHNHTQGEFWPFVLYQYEPGSDSYVEIGGVTAWDKEIAAVSYEGQPFPDELDADGDGTVFAIWGGAESSGGSAEYKYDQADYEEWIQSAIGGAKELSIEYLPMKYESFADFVPSYLKLLADEAGKGRTDTASDLGLLILNEEHFLDAAKELLAEEYGVKLEQPEPDFEEWTVGLKDKDEVFSFEALNAGHIGYEGEKVEDVTIFGIYPGISVDAAWEKLKAYGFYASSYGEVENCLITGEGFGNVSIWFSAEDDKVTQITAGPYCAFAG